MRTYPVKEHSLVGVDGNAFCVMGTVSSWMRDANFTKEEIDEYVAKAKSSDYNNLLVVSMEYTDKVNDRLREDGRLIEDEYEDEDE